MKVYDAPNIRNLALVGHGGCGKTSLASALLFDAGAMNRLGRVDDGTTVTDFDPDEIERKISLLAAPAFAEWKKSKINLIDAPGYANFLSEARAALRVVDAALVVVDATPPGHETESCGLALADAAYYMVVPVNPMTNEKGGSTYSIGVVRVALPGQAAIGLPLLPLSNGPVSWYTARILEALGLLWFDAAAGVWVPHFRDMPPGVYDAPVVQARAYQVSTRLPTTYVFVGW